MHNLSENKIKAIVKNLAVAFFFTAFFVFLVLILFQKQIDKTFTLINKVAVVSVSKDKKKSNIKINKLEKRLLEYPSYGDVFGTIKIPS